MTLDITKNFAKVEVNTGYAAGATSIALKSGDGAKLPDPTTDGEFNLVWWNVTDYSDPSDDPSVEIVRVTARSTDTLTVTRAQESTSDVAHNTSGKTYYMILGPTKKTIDDIESDILWETDGTKTQLKTADEIDIQSKKIINVTDPASNQDAATKKYVDDNAGGAPEGTAVLSTGEGGATKFLRENGDGTSSWQTPAGSGDVTASANLTDETIVQGDGGAKGVKTSTATIAQIESAVTHYGDATGADHSDIVTAVGLNTAKDTNVSTNLSLGAIDATTMVVASSDGTDATLIEADTDDAGLLGADKWDEIVANSLKVTNATHSGDVTGATALTISANKVNDTHIDWGTGANQVSAVDVPIADGGSIITATEVEAALQENRTAINLNTSKNTNVPTELSVGTVGVSTVAITSDGGADDVTLPASTNAAAGVATAAQITAVEANTAHITADGSSHADVATNTTHGGLTNNPHSVTKAQVGLTNVNDSSTTNGLWETSGGNTQLKTADDVDFAKLKAIQMVCDNGATLPATPADAQWFCHTPTGRTVLMQYSSGAGAWIPIMNIGASTIYVDGGSGTDDLDLGGASGAGAFATIQYAVDSLAGLVGGNVIINLSADIYREKVTYLGKTVTGNYIIKIAGSLSVNDSGTATSGANSTLTDTGASWTVNALRGKKIAIVGGTGDGQEKLIASNTATIITIVGKWFSSNVDNTSQYEVYDRDTRVTGADAGADTTAVRDACFEIRGKSLELHDMLLDYCTTYVIACEGGTELCIFKNLELANSSVIGFSSRYGAKATIRLMYINSNVFGTILQKNTGIEAAEVYIYNSGHTGMKLSNSGFYLPTTVSDGELRGSILIDNSVNNGISISLGGVLDGPSTAGIINRCTNNGGWGAFAETGGQGRVQNWTYSGNTSGTYTPSTTLAGGTN